MSYATKKSLKKSKQNVNGFGIDDLTDVQNKNILFGMLGKYKGITSFIFLILFGQIAINILVLLMVFKLI